MCKWIDWIAEGGRIALDVLVPRFITEDVALARVGPGNEWHDFDVVCPMSDVLPGEEFSGIAEADSFTWLGFGVCYRIGNFRPWIDQQEVVNVAG